ncbi:hypothetical protein [Marinomonas sp. 2405UD68-3]|uniref:hypothetical protein n=1 Tax=Marinomonas sp. 2405UD68-3 TaxID=3391835 RepID=UPI0039C8CF1B
MNEESKVARRVSFVQIDIEKDSIMTALPPYMSPKRWALLIDKTEGAVKKDLQTGVIARYQPVVGGLVYVNVVKEMQRAEAAADY